MSTVSERIAALPWEKIPPTLWESGFARLGILLSLPDIVAGLRSALYPHLRAIANPWMAALGLEVDYPTRLKTFLEQCAARGQTRPTPLLLRYRTGDFNCLHQDIYGE